MAEGGTAVADRPEDISLVGQVARRLRERRRPFRYIAMDGDGEITGMSEGPPAPPGAVNCILITMPREDGSHADSDDTDIETAVARFVRRGGVIHHLRDSDD
jgi:hypothetical protein